MIHGALDPHLHVKDPHDFVKKPKGVIKTSAEADAAIKDMSTSINAKLIQSLGQ